MALRVVLLWALVAGASPAASQELEPKLPSPLSLGQALELFRHRGFDLLLSEAAVEGAVGDLEAAGAVPNLGVSGSYGKSFACDTGPCRTLPEPAWTGTLTDNNALESAVSGKIALRVDAARAALRAAKLSHEDALRSLTAQLKQAFLQVLQAQESVRYALEAQQQSNELLSLTQLRYQHGAISEADVARVQTDKLETDQALDNARMNLRSAQLALTFLLGFRRSAPEVQVAGEEYLHYASLRTEEAPVASMVQRALENRPDLRAARAQVERAQAAGVLARRQVFPDIAVSLSYAQEGTSATAITPPTVAVGLSTTLPLFYQQQGEVRKAEADLRTQRLSVQKAEAQVVGDVEGAYAGYQTSRRLAQRMEGSLLARAKRARDLVALQYQKGAASLLELLDANRTYRAVGVEYLQDVTGYWTSVFRLEQAVGVELK